MYYNVGLGKITAKINLLSHFHITNMEVTKQIYLGCYFLRPTLYDMHMCYVVSETLEFSFGHCTK